MYVEGYICKQWHFATDESAKENYAALPIATRGFCDLVHLNKNRAQVYRSADDTFIHPLSRVPLHSLVPVTEDRRL